MVDLKPILGKLIEQLPSVINELSPEEFKVVQDTLNLARERVSEELVSEEDRIPKGAEFLYLLAGGDPKAFAKYAKQVPDTNINRIATNKTTLDLSLIHI